MGSHKWPVYVMVDVDGEKPHGIQIILDDWSFLPGQQDTTRLALEALASVAAVDLRGQMALVTPHDIASSTFRQEVIGVAERLFEVREVIERPRSA